MTDTNTSGADVLPQDARSPMDIVTWIASAGSYLGAPHRLPNLAEKLKRSADYVAALIEREAAQAKRIEELEQIAAGHRDGRLAALEKAAALESERDALAAEAKALREDAGRWHEIAARYDAASGLQCANVLAAFGYPHDQPWFPLGHFVDAARTPAATGDA